MREKTMHTIHALIIDLTLITIYAGITTLICNCLLYTSDAADEL